MSDTAIIRVEDVMTASVKTVDRMATVADAITIMRDSGVSSLVVERRDDADEFGVVVITDIAREVIAKDRSKDRVQVYEIMQKPVLTLAREMQTKYAVRLLTQYKLSRALVIDHERRPCGIVTLRDMVLKQ